MTNPLFKFTSPYADKKKSRHIPVILLKTDHFPAWLKKQKPHVKTICEQTGFKANAERILVVRDSRGGIESIVAGIRNPCSVYDTGAVVTGIRQFMTKDLIKSATFYFTGELLKRTELEYAYTGWGFGGYQFTAYKNGAETPLLLWAKGLDKSRILTTVESIYFLRNLINAPANAMGPDELEEAARFIAKKNKAAVKTTTDRELLHKNFPLIHAVGDGSDRRPRLIDIEWGNPKHPLLTLVGKGVAFDTGGLNLKPTPAMALMKKDMGGAAHVLALGNLIMKLNVPVRLRILIAAVENSVSGRSFRPGDILKSRKGLTVENTNTDAEGRLILADALTYACEKKTDLIIDFATLTGSARAGLGPEIPPVFTNDDTLAEKLKKISFAIDDPVWPMPLWQPYRKLIESPVADLVNSTSIPGDLIFSALFLQQFLSGNPHWLHLDIYAWEHTGRSGRPRGGADTGLRAVLALIEDRYAKKTKKR
jgi:leucyl aminopeptidase